MGTLNAHRPPDHFEIDGLLQAKQLSAIEAGFKIWQRELQRNRSF